jgi:hypothetical protein
VVYIFGPDGKFVDLWSGGPYTKGQPYDVPLWLEPGDYQFAVVTNPGGMNRIPFTRYELAQLRPGIDLIEMSIGMDDTKTITEYVPTLNIGNTDIETVVDNPGYDQDINIVIRPQTYKVNFHTIGLPSDHTFEFRRTDENFLRDLENNLSVLPVTISTTCARAN